MNKVKAGLRGLNGLQKENLAYHIYTSMNGNPLFTESEPTMSELHAAYEVLQAANIQATDRGRIAIIHRNSTVERMDRLLTRLAAYVNSVCLGDAVALSSSGFALAHKPVPITNLEAPQRLRVRRTNFPDRMLVQWQRVQGAIIYEVEALLPGFLDWQRVELTSRPELMVAADLAHPNVQFRVCAVGRKAQSPYSGSSFLLVA
ncbi:MAG: fibronectin type III domain-containing protein [Flavobacteriales bacterium]|nr:fibronectin type III domain-containing protein [Flavobacteriales bacterium]